MNHDENIMRSEIHQTQKDTYRICAFLLYDVTGKKKALCFHFIMAEDTWQMGRGYEVKMIAFIKVSCRLIHNPLNLYDNAAV